MKFTIFMSLVLVGFFYLVYLGIERSGEEVQLCKQRGGYPMLERGVYHDCVIGIKSIDK